MQNSVFVPSDSGAKVPQWMNGNQSNASDSRKVIQDIENLLKVSRTGADDVITQLPENIAQSGGKRKGSKRASKKSSKSTRKGSKKQTGGKHKVKNVGKAKGSKKSKGSRKSAKGSRKTKRQTGGKGMPKAMQDILDLAKVIKTEMPDLKGGPPLNSVASQLIKLHGNVDVASAEVKKTKDKIRKMYAESVKKIAEKRAAKKASKDST